MKVRIFLIAGILAVLFSTPTAMFAQYGVNRIEGRVMDETNNGIDNVYIELYNDVGSVVARGRTTGQGRFTFRGMGPGRYVVYAKPFGTNFLEDTKDIEIDNSTSRSTTVTVDFRLRSDKRSAATDPVIVGTVFAQEVPPEAKRLYKSGVDQIRSKPDQALADLEAAVKLFPNYFDALAALGKAYVSKGKYTESYPILLRALEVNKKCSDCYYSLALAFYRLNELAAATKGIDAAVILQANNPAVRLLQGMIYRSNNDLPGAEKALLQAKVLFKVPNPEVHWQLSLVYNKLKRNHEAADELELYLKIKPDMSPAEKENVRNLIIKLRKST